MTIPEAYEGRVEVFIDNGTVKIMHVQRNDSGEYTIDIFESDGMHLKKVELILHVRSKYNSFYNP